MEEEMLVGIEEIYSRRSIRKFKDREVPIEVIREMLRAGIAAPSAKNRQPWRYIVFGGEQKREILAAMERGLEREQQGITDLPGSGFGLPNAWYTLRIMQEAPVLIVVLNTNGTSPFLPIGNDARVAEICDSLAIGASIENMLLAAECMGLGTLWIGNTCFAYPELEAYLATSHQIIGAVAVGYADERPGRRPRRGIDEAAEFRM